MKVCQYCGAVNDDDKLTCEKCGGTLGLIPDGQAQTAQPVQPQSQQATTPQKADNKKSMIIIAALAVVAAIIIILFLFVFKKDNSDSSSIAPEQTTPTTVQTTTASTAQTTTTKQTTTTAQTTTAEQTTTAAHTTTSGELSDAEKQAALEKANSIAKIAYSALGDEIADMISDGKTVSSINMNAPLPVETLKISDNSLLRALYRALEKADSARGYIYIRYNADSDFYDNGKYNFVQWLDDKNFYIWAEKKGGAVIGQFPNAPKTVDQCPQFGKNNADGTTTTQSQASAGNTPKVTVAKEDYANAIIGTWLDTSDNSTMTLDKLYRFSMDVSGLKLTGTYELNGEILKTTYSFLGETAIVTFRIKSLSDAEMILADTQDESKTFVLKKTG